MPNLSRPGATLYYEHYGDGEPLIFAHGAGGNAAIWYNQLAFFGDRYLCVAFDHRGFARSPCTGGAITVREFRDDLLAIMDALQIDKAHLVGQSMGGFTALRTTLDYPDRILSLTLSCTSGGIVNPNPTPAMQNLTRATGSDPSGVKATMAKATFAKPHLVQLYECINNFNTDFSWDKLAGLLTREDVVRLEQLQQIECPTLFFAGAEDPLFPAELLTSYVPHFQRADIEIVKDAGHSPYFEQPDRFNRRLQKHLQSAAI